MYDRAVWRYTSYLTELIGDGFIKNAAEYAEEGKYSVSWDFSFTPGVEVWRMGVTDALTKYSAGTADWSEVENAFVGGWERQYKEENQ